MWGRELGLVLELRSAVDGTAGGEEETGDCVWERRGRVRRHGLRELNMLFLDFVPLRC